MLFPFCRSSHSANITWLGYRLTLIGIWVHNPWFDRIEPIRKLMLIMYRQTLIYIPNHCLYTQAWIFPSVHDWYSVMSPFCFLLQEILHPYLITYQSYSSKRKFHSFETQNRDLPYALINVSFSRQTLSLELCIHNVSIECLFDFSGLNF